MAKTAKAKSTTSTTHTPGKVFGPALEAAALKPIASLIPYARNSRTHSADQVAQLARSMEKFGWTMPVLIDPKGNIIAGHGRVLAAQKLGFKEVPCLVAKGWTAEQRRLYVIADNQLALNANWDPDVLASELADLKEAKADLTLTGLSAKELDKSLKVAANNAKGGVGQIGDLQYRVVVDCKDEAHQGEMLARLESEGLPCRALIS